ncbi:hypothetical protein ASPZODRAFT_98952 [Penicilliopsis zonata CBS 506.65]|uniref:FAD-binding domain-containing protein n=1 Tax=Penicilliopsis zonata CBS 506.65 TaxID=1073090 RepID=A0A1L9SF74_9EURO|nr:hypothetical protein ASPZODRAFT_98952 [Penicilliopsis zonata CBS 506.65]OJJ45925.1 hypothetical protein ASPZODRAFT_98952 [Penicilliopsis zonata CBS 506.65]
MSIAIIGGGPGGLTLALLLHRKNIPFTVYERRARPTAAELASPSGMLDMHDESGLAALRECGVYDDFFNLTTECSEAQKVADKEGNILYDENTYDTSAPIDTHRPEISRHALVGLLLSRLPEGSIKWNHRVEDISIENKTNDRIKITFNSSPTVHVDILIGADGAWSTVRKALTPSQPIYSGIQNVTATVRNVRQRYPSLAALVGTGSFAALGMRHSVMTQRGPQDSVRVYLMISSPEEDFPSTSGMKGETAEHVATEILLKQDSLFATWGDNVKELIAVACREETLDHPGEPVDVKPLYRLPVGLEWNHVPGVTLIGDAAHLMCPWAGEGVNLAMWDALSLAEVIGKAYGGKHLANFDPLLKQFEVDMIARAKEKAQETLQNGEWMFGDDGARIFADFFRNMAEGN